ncbi:MAG: hypothetical protein MI700_03885 [Balneolales bacterium]|nr:hypothetical protein [Balneolales bacterium]
MSISNINRSYYTNSTLDYSSAYAAQQKAVPEVAEQKSFLEDSSSNQSFNEHKKQAGSSKFYLNVAHQLFDELTSGFEDLESATFENLHPSLFSKKSYKSGQYNLIDLKRHQNYFDQMMNFDNPSGSWIDQNV